MSENENDSNFFVQVALSILTVIFALIVMSTLRIVGRHSVRLIKKIRVRRAPQNLDVPV